MSGLCQAVAVRFPRRLVALGEQKDGPVSEAREKRTSKPARCELGSTYGSSCATGTPVFWLPASLREPRRYPMQPRPDANGRTDPHRERRALVDGALERSTVADVVCGHQFANDRSGEGNPCDHEPFSDLSSVVLPSAAMTVPVPGSLYGAGLLAVWAVKGTAVQATNTRMARMRARSRSFPGSFRRIEEERQAGVTPAPVTAAHQPPARRSPSRSGPTGFGTRAVCSGAASFRASCPGQRWSRCDGSLTDPGLIGFTLGPNLSLWSVESWHPGPAFSHWPSPPCSC